MPPASTPFNLTPSPLFQLPEIPHRQTCPESVTHWRQHIICWRCIAVNSATRKHDGSYIAWTGASSPLSRHLIASLGAKTDDGLAGQRRFKTAAFWPGLTSLDWPVCSTAHTGALAQDGPREGLSSSEVTRIRTRWILPRRQREQEVWKPSGTWCPGGSIRRRGRVYRRC
jgi:hypothetical protein